MNENANTVNKYNFTKMNCWLSEFARNVTSQYGENGIIEKVLEVIGKNDKWCVEFGSWDGKRCSNSFDLIDNKGYAAVLIEGDYNRFLSLQNTFKGNKKVISINKFVGFQKEDGLDSILSSTDIPVDFDLLSIDIDGNDYHVWQSFNDYKPKVVVIEFNPTIPSTVEFIQPRDMSITQGSSILSIANLGKSKGYELVACTKNNAIFVDAKYFERFEIEDNSPTALRTDESAITHIFCGYDGTVFIRGYGRSPWQSIAFKESKMQLLPKWARKKVGDCNVIRRKAGKIFRRLRKKNII
jgi:hypothetical protein